MKKVSGEKGRLRVFLAEFEGSDETIQEGLKSIASAIHKTFEGKVRFVKALPIHGKEGEPEDLEDASNEVPSEDEPSDIGVESPTSARSRKPPTMTLVKDLDFMPDGKQSLRDFYATKAPESQQEAIAVFTYYLSKVLEIKGITPNHIFTCFKDVEKRSPKDLPQTIRNTASRNGWVDSGSQDDIKITNHGENLVEHDLPRKKSEV